MFRKNIYRMITFTMGILLVLSLIGCEDNLNNSNDDEILVGGDSKLVVEDCWMTGFGVGLSSLELNFYLNGDFIYEIYWTLSNNSPLFEEIYKGTYYASNGILTLTFKSAEHKDVFNDKDWESIPLPKKLSLSYTVGYNEYSFYLLEIEGALPGIPESYEEDGLSLYIWKDGAIYTP